MAVELDRVALFGTGTPPKPQGIVNFAGVESVVHGAALTLLCAPHFGADQDQTGDVFRRAKLTP